MSCKACVGISKGHIVCPFKYLDYCLIFIYFYDTADFLCTVFHTEFYDFLKRGIFNPFQDNKRAVYFT